VFFPHITDEGLVEVVSSHFDGRADNGAAQGNHGDIRRTASDIDDHVTAGLGDVDSGSDGCRNRLLDDADLSGACVVGGVLNGLLFHLCGAAGDADCDPRLS